MSRILAVGIATLDIINTVESYPAEDAEIRAVEQRVCRGGNATNTLVALSQLGHDCFWAGVSVDEPDAKHIFSELAHFHIHTQYCRILQQGKVPTSYINLSKATGSRTIVHHRDLPEYGFAEFDLIDCSRFDWVHFEGRNMAETAKMLQKVKKEYPQLTCSLEIEKPREDMEKINGLADVVLFSRAYANELGYDDAEVFLESQRPLHPESLLICAWGEQGAYALGDDNALYESPAFPPSEVRDTLAAGDVFNAGIIDSLTRGQALEQALISACQLAGKKCGQLGLGELAA